MIEPKDVNDSYFNVEMGKNYIKKLRFQDPGNFEYEEWLNVVKIIPKRCLKKHTRLALFPWTHLSFLLKEVPSL